MRHRRAGDALGVSLLAPPSTSLAPCRPRPRSRRARRSRSEARQQAVGRASDSSEASTITGSRRCGPCRAQRVARRALGLGENGVIRTIRMEPGRLVDRQAEAQLARRPRGDPQRLPGCIAHVWLCAGEKRTSQPSIQRCSRGALALIPASSIAETGNRDSECRVQHDVAPHRLLSAAKLVGTSALTPCAKSKNATAPFDVGSKTKPGTP